MHARRIAIELWLLLILLTLLLAGCRTAPSPTDSALPATVIADAPAGNTVDLPPPQVAITNTIVEPTAAAGAAEPAAPTAPPPPTPTPQPRTEERVLLQTAGGNLIGATRIGSGPFKVVLAGSGSGALAALADALRAAPQRVPIALTLWLLPEINPDAGFDVLRDADTSFNGCARNFGLGRAFESAEARALRDFVSDAAFVLFLERSSALVLHNDACAQQPLADGVARFLAAELGQANAAAPPAVQPMPALAGHFVDYLAGQGIAALTLGHPPDALPADAAWLDALLRHLAGEFARSDRGDIWLTDGRLATWQLARHALVHPLALVERLGIVYVLDGGRVLAIDPAFAGATLVPLLLPGDVVEGVRVLEPLDLAADAEALYVLDRAGDVYRYADGGWTIDRYDRPVRDRSAHYYVALAAAERRYLLETSAPLLLRYAADEKRTLLPDTHYPVDVAIGDETAYLLLHAKDGPGGMVVRSTLGEDRGQLRLGAALVQPRQLVTHGDSLYVLTREGRQVLQFDRASGQLRNSYRFPDQRLIAAVAARADGTLLLATRDALHFYNPAVSDPPDRHLPTDHLALANPPHDPAWLTRLDFFSIPIGIPVFIQRDYQMAGAPRHYRLGVHEGYDFYWQRGSVLSAAADGVVIRADLAYVEPSAAEFAGWIDESARQGYTSDAASDFFRGQQLWIDHGNGIVTRYVHLSAIEPGIALGSVVTRGQPIARVGNSGSPGMLVSPEEDAHLHLEIRIDDGYVGQFIRPIEAREWLRRILR